MSTKTKQPQEQPAKDVELIPADLDAINADLDRLHEKLAQARNMADAALKEIMPLQTKLTRMRIAYYEGKLKPTA